MSLKVAIFEDDKEVADLLKDMMESKDFIVNSFYSLKDKGWTESDIVLGDFRNKIVSFNELKKECHKNSIPLIAISGNDTDYTPQLLKPFGIDDLQSMILDSLMKSNKKLGSKPENKSSGSLFGLFKKSS